jgi:hypothetical protein
MRKVVIKISKKSLFRAAKNSSKLEGIDVLEAKKDVSVINLLKKHGRAFSI